MKKFLLVALSGLFISVPAKTQIKTNCNTSGSNTNCTSSDPTAGYNAAGYALGAGLGVAVDRHRVGSFCRKNPGQNYRGHQCPTENEQTVIALQRFIVYTPKFRQSDKNIEILGGWVDDHHLDRTDRRSYRKAWDALKKTGKLELNK